MIEKIKELQRYKIIFEEDRKPQGEKNDKSINSKKQ